MKKIRIHSVTIRLRRQMYLNSMKFKQKRHFEEKKRLEFVKEIKCIGRMSLLKDPIFTVRLNRTIKILIFHLLQDLPSYFTCELFHAYFIVALK